MEVLPLCLILIGVRQKAGTLLEVKIAASVGSRAEGDELRGRPAVYCLLTCVLIYPLDCFKLTVLSQ